MELYKAKVKRFKNGKVKMREYDHLMKVPKKNKNERVKKDSSTKKKSDGVITGRSLARTRNNLIELVENNEDKFKSFITLTYKEDVEDIDEAYKDLRSYFKSVKRKLLKNDEELYYIAVPEIQHQRAKKTGKYVIHFHIIANIEIDSPLITKREPKQVQGENHKGTKSLLYYDLPYWSKGYSFAIPIERNEQFELSLYLLKYLYKDMDNRFYGRQKILHSNNLKVPDFEYYKDEDKIDSIKNENKENIKEVFYLMPQKTEHPFTEYIYKCPQNDASNCV